MTAQRKPRKTQPKLAAVSQEGLVPDQPATPAGPVVLGANPRPTVPVFVLDDVTYSIPDKINPLVSNRYLEKFRDEGGEVAGLWLLRKLFGDAVMDALSEAPYVSPEDIAAISEKVGAIVFPPRKEAEPAATGN